MNERKPAKKFSIYGDISLKNYISMRAIFLLNITLLLYLGV